jgi:ribosomal protein L11 methyltransferase
MNYIEFTITVPHASREAVLNRVMELGSLGIVERAGDFVAYFPADSDGGEISGALDAFRHTLKSSGLDPDFSYVWAELPDQDWNESWKKSFSPIPVGRRLSILPPWEDVPEGRTGIIVDPGMAFGTGHHETTKTCLELIEEWAPRLRGSRFLDIGTGTGILAIAAVRLGFSEAVGLDTDPLAVEAASRNVSLNGLDSVHILPGDISAARGTYGMIVANLISGVLIGIARKLAARLEPQGIVVLSGMLAGQEDDVIRAALKAGLGLKDKLSDGKWVTLVMTAAKTGCGIKQA